MTNEFLSLSGLSATVRLDGNDARLLSEAVSVFLRETGKRKKEYEDAKLPEWRYLTALTIADEQQLEAFERRVRNAIAGAEDEQ